MLGARRTAAALHVAPVRWAGTKGAAGAAARHAAVWSGGLLASACRPAAFLALLVLLLLRHGQRRDSVHAWLRWLRSQTLFGEALSGHFNRQSRLQGHRVCFWLQRLQNWIFGREALPSRVVRLTGPDRFAPAIYRLGDELGRCSIGGKVLACAPQPALEGGAMTRVAFIVPRYRVASRGPHGGGLEQLLDLRHPSILAHERILSDDRSLYIVAERPLGPNLLHWFVAQNCWCGEVAARLLMTQLLGALAYLQRARVLHRDVKLESLLFDRDVAQPERCAALKLSDFTLAHPMPPGKRCCQAPVAGTLMYAAPEALEGMCHAHTDCFNAGVVLFILLVSAPPFASETESAYLQSVHSKDWALATDVAGVSTVARSLLAELLEPRPARRQNAGKALTHRWVSSDCYATAADKVNGEWANEDGAYALRFLKECGTAVGASCSLSLTSASDSKCEPIPEEEDEDEDLLMGRESYLCS